MAKRTYSVQDVAYVLNLSPQTVYKWVKDGKLRAVRLGRKIVISEKALKEYLGEENYEELFSDIEIPRRERKRRKKAGA